MQGLLTFLPARAWKLFRCCIASRFADHRDKRCRDVTHEIVRQTDAMSCAKGRGNTAARKPNATVTIAHSRTQRIEDVCLTADILIAASDARIFDRGGS